MLLQITKVHLFLWLSKFPLYIYTTSYLSIYLLRDTGHFHNSTIANNATMDIWVHISCQINVFVFFGYIRRNEIVVSYGSSIFHFLRNIHTISMVAVRIFNPPPLNQGSLFSTQFPTFLICGLFENSHSDRCEVISHCGFDFHYSGN